jgi:hypothetical protein
MLVICFALNVAKAADTSELIRASIIEKIVRFIEWPAPTQDQLTLCVIQRPPLLSAIQDYYANSLINEKPVNILTINNLSNISECQIIYLDEEQTNEISNIQKIIHGSPILIIAEKKNAVLLGAHLGFFIEENRLRLEVNQKELTSSGFKVSYHLLKGSRIVD